MPFFAISCVEDLAGPGMDMEQRETVTVTLHSNASTKTMLVDGKHVVWEAGDIVDINERLYEVRIDENNPEIAYVEGVEAADVYYAHYSASWYYYEEEGIYFDLPTLQYYREGGFNSFTNQMIAYGTTTDLYFYNAASIIKLGLKGNGERVRSVTLTGNAGEFLSGNYLVPYEDFENLKDFGGIVADTLSIKRTYVQMEVNGEISLSASPQYVYLVVPPQTFANGITVTVTDMDGMVCHQSTPKSITVKRSEILPMADFVFNASEALAISDLNAGATNVAYTVTAAPGKRIGHAVVPKAMWDLYMANYGAGYESAAANDILNRSGYAFIIPESGSFAADVWNIRNENGNELPLLADTDYKVIASYASAGSVGAVAVKDFRTLQAGGEAPGIAFETAAGSSEIHINVKVSDNAAGIICVRDTKERIDELVQSGLSVMDIANLWGIFEDAESAKSEEGYTYSYSELEKDTDYSFIYAVVTETGAAIVQRVDLRTRDPFGSNGVWELYTDNAVMDCGLLAGFSIENFMLGSLKVEKLNDMDVFRIVDLNEALNSVIGDSFLVFDEPQYFYIDARDAGRVSLPYSMNSLYLPDGEIILCSTADFSTLYMYGTYDFSSGAIYFGDVAMMIAGEGPYIVGNTTTLYLSEALLPEPAQEWYVVGGFNAWTCADANYKMTEIAGYYVLRNFTLEVDSELKFNTGTWDVNRGGDFVAVNAPVELIENGVNIRVPAGTYDVYMNKTADRAYFMAPGAVPDSGGGLSSEDFFKEDEVEW